MNRPIIVAVMALAVFFSGTIVSIPLASAQYGVGGNPTTAPTKEQQAECDQYSIPQSQCTELALLAKRRVIYADQNAASKDKGSGTAYLTGGMSGIAVIAALGAIFGGVAAAFFIKGRGSKPIAT